MFWDNPILLFAAAHRSEALDGFFPRENFPVTARVRSAGLDDWLDPTI
jgi:hypothetical protein